MPDRRGRLGQPRQKAVDALAAAKPAFYPEGVKPLRSQSRQDCEDDLEVSAECCDAGDAYASGVNGEAADVAHGVRVPHD